MIKKIFWLICIAIMTGNVCKAQTSDSKTNINWGESVRGVRLSIVLSNTVVGIGSTTFISATIQNLFTNIVGMTEEGEMRDFDIFLISSLGEEHRLTPDTSRWRHTLRLLIKINPGESRDWKLPLTISKEFDPGNYTLKVSTKHVGFEIASNLLKVQIK